MAVVFNLLSEYNHAGVRQFAFMIKGVRELPPKFAKNNIEFIMTRGDPVKNIPDVLKQHDPSLVVFDYIGTRPMRKFMEDICNKVDYEVHQVDNQNIVPVWKASDKRESGARTIRSKIHKLLPEFLTDFPATPTVKTWDGKKPEKVDWDKVVKEVQERGGKDVPELKWLKPGEDAGLD